MTQPQHDLPKKERRPADPLRDEVDKEESSLLPFHEHPRSAIDDIKSLDVFHDEYYDDEDVKEEDLEPALTRDVYSLLYTSAMFGTGFNFALMIFLLQFSLLMLLFFNLFDTSNDPNTTNNVENRLKLPAGVEYTVTFAQFLGLLLTVMIMANDGDAMQGISQLVEGYEKDILYDSPNATCTRWLFSGILQTTNGIMFVVLSFMLTMQSTDVIGLFLNLTGLIFLQEIDDWGFQLGCSGLLGRRVQKECDHVLDLKQLVPETMKKRIIYAKRAFLVLLTVGVLVPFGFIADGQSKGKYLCQTVYVQFGDSYFPQYAYYSGLFEKLPTKFLDDYYNRRAVYVDATNTLQLSWCAAERAWTFSHTTGPSCNYIFKSSESLSFDVLDVAGSNWFVKTNQTGDLPVDWLTLACNDCSKNEERCNGNCVENKCTNDDPNLRGLNFEFPGADCLFFAADQTTTSSLYAISGASFFLKNFFTALPIKKKMKDRLIYTTYAITDDGDIVSTFLLFSGRRWIVFGFPQGLTTPLTSGELALFMEENDPDNYPVRTLNNISSYPLLSVFRPIFFSSAVDYGTDTYSVEPSAVTWLRAEEDPSELILGYRADETKPVDVKLHCGGCNNKTNPCNNNGICDSSLLCPDGGCASNRTGDGLCRCPVFFGGLLCEYALGCGEADNSCFNNGTCNARTNICACEPGHLGNLCQYGPETLGDPFFCTDYSCNNGDCSCTSTWTAVGEIEAEGEVEDGINGTTPVANGTTPTSNNTGGVTLPSNVLDNGTLPNNVFGNATLPNNIFDNTTLPNKVFDNVTQPNIVFDNATLPNNVFDNATLPNNFFDNATESGAENTTVSTIANSNSA